MSKKNLFTKTIIDGHEILSKWHFDITKTIEEYSNLRGTVKVAERTQWGGGGVGGGEGKLDAVAKRSGRYRRPGPLDGLSNLENDIKGSGGIRPRKGNSANALKVANKHQAAQCRIKGEVSVWRLIFCLISKLRRKVTKEVPQNREVSFTVFLEVGFKRMFGFLLKGKRKKNAAKVSVKKLLGGVLL